MAAVLSIQSAVVHGHVGLAASTLALQRRGIEVWGLPTVLLSNHTGYPGWIGRRLPATEVAELGEGLAANGLLGRCDAVLSGYLGTAETGAALRGIVNQVRAERPAARYLCDPVLGDAGKGLYLPEEVGHAYRALLLPLADIAAPNQFELGWLTGAPIDGLEDVIAAAHRLRASGPELVYVTSVTAGLGSDQIGLLAVGAGGAWLACSPRVPYDANGAGDLTAALIMADMLAGTTPAETAGRVAATLHAVIARTHAEGAAELALVATQHLLATPPDAAPAEKVA